jgi:transcriptional regulator with XRE-family HTH domain
MAEFNQLGQYLKEKRVESGYTQAELANKLGDVHSQFVSNWERGLCAPPSHAFQDLIAILKLNREKLVEVMLVDSQSVIEAKV